MSVLTDSGRAVIAESIAERPIHLAWGIGDGQWDTPPAEDVAATGLINEVGRRKVFQVSHVAPADDGDIVVPTGRFTPSDVPTGHLYLAFRFDFEDAANEVIRELGVFVGTQPKDTAPPGKLYLLPDELADGGTLLLLEHIAPLYRNAASRQTFEFVISF